MHCVNVAIFGVIVHTTDAIAAFAIKNKETNPFLCIVLGVRRSKVPKLN